MSNFSSLVGGSTRVTGYSGQIRAWRSMRKTGGHASRSNDRHRLVLSAVSTRACEPGAGLGSKAQLGPQEPGIGGCSHPRAYNVMKTFHQITVRVAFRMIGFDQQAAFNAMQCNVRHAHRT